MAVFMFYIGVFCIGFGILAAISSFIERFIWQGGKTRVYTIYSIVTAGNHGGIIKDYKIKSPGKFPRVFLRPYGPASAARIPAGCLYAGIIKSAIAARQRRQEQKTGP